MLPLFLVIAFTFIPIGLLVVFLVGTVDEFELDYTDCLSTSHQNLTCADVISPPADPGPCACAIDFILPREIRANAFMYYGLEGYYANYRLYAKSLDYDQFRGAHLSSKPSSDCHPQRYSQGDNSKPIAPCGLVANAIFNDSLRLTFGRKRAVPLRKRGITWDFESRRFRNPPGDLQSELKNFTRPPNWQRNVWQLDPDDEENNGFQNEDFIVWMHMPAFTTFRKLYRIIDHSRDRTFEDGLPTGRYTLHVLYQYPVRGFGGRKKMFLSNTNILGGKNPFLGYAFIVVGGIFLLVDILIYFVPFEYHL